MHVSIAYGRRLRSVKVGPHYVLNVRTLSIQSISPPPLTMPVPGPPLAGKSHSNVLVFTGSHTCLPPFRSSSFFSLPHNAGSGTRVGRQILDVSYSYWLSFAPDPSASFGNVLAQTSAEAASLHGCESFLLLCRISLSLLLRRKAKTPMLAGAIAGKDPLI
jgi:hypothetical protein